MIQGKMVKTLKTLSKKLFSIGDRYQGIYEFNVIFKYDLLFMTLLKW